MKFIKYCIPALIVLTCACKGKKIEQPDSTHIETISVDTSQKKIDYKQLFSTWKIVPLQTSRNSLIGAISRMYSFNGRYYVLDKKTSSVLIFKNDGVFIDKIQASGYGPGEYTDLMDFCINEQNKQLILYSHRPYKLLTYDLDGHFLEERRLKELYDNIAYDNGRILFMNSRYSRGNLLLSKDLNNKNEKDFLRPNPSSKLFQNFRLITPNVIKSRSINITFPYSDTIYNYHNDSLSARYVINFKNKVPVNLVKTAKDPFFVYKNVITNNYGLAITNFKETKDFVYFSYGPNILVFYSKKDKATKTFKFIVNNDEHIEFGQFFAHDGDDNDVTSIYPSYRFKSIMSAYKKNRTTWAQVPQKLKDIDAASSADSNPLLIIYTLK